MTTESRTKKAYDKYGAEYQKTRNEKPPTRLYNEFLEVPNMISALGNIKNKKILDVGCGAGVHIKKYLKKGALCEGVDISQTMIDLAKKNCPTVQFRVSTMRKLPYKGASFDIVTASLSIDYIKDLAPAFQEINRVLKKGGLFYYSNNSPIACARQRYEDDEIKIVGIGRFTNKKTGKQINVGQAWHEGLTKRQMVPGMKMETYHKTFRTQLLSLRNAGFELVDFIDCKPTTTFKKYDPLAYAHFSKYPVFSIYVAQKK